MIFQKAYPFLFFTLCLLFSTDSFSQTKLKQGFSVTEYQDMLAITVRQSDTVFHQPSIPFNTSYQRIYRSEVVGLESRFDIWLSDDSIAVISLRATTRNSISWLSNFYAAMVPASGKIELSQTKAFEYSLAKNKEAAVHVGWILALAHMIDDINENITSLYKKGVRDIIITGHSQGGAIAYLLTAYLNQNQKKIQLPLDLYFKTYCSAAPKPGNLYFAYEFELNNPNSAFNVINPKDWVPESPVSIQTMNDFNPISPFRNADHLMKHLKFPEKMAVKYAFRKLDKPTRKAQRRYERYLGKVVSKFVRQQLDGFNPPKYYCSNNYVRTGVSIILPVNEAYEQYYPDSETNLFVHHQPGAYYYLSRLLEK